MFEWFIWCMVTFIVCKTNYENRCQKEDIFAMEYFKTLILNFLKRRVGEFTFKTNKNVRQKEYPCLKPISLAHTHTHMFVFVKSGDIP